MKKSMLIFSGLFVLLMVVGMVSAGSVEHKYGGVNICHNPTADIFIGFEDGTDMAEISTQYPDVTFSGETTGTSWTYSDVTTGHYGYPMYWIDENFSSFLTNTGGALGATGKLEFATEVTYVSVLVSAGTQVYLEAYDASGTLIDTAGPTGDNLNSNTMDRLTVAGDIKYVLIHDTGSFWVMDDVCIGKHTVIPSPEFPTMFLPATLIIGFLGVILLIQRTREH